MKDVIDAEFEMVDAKSAEQKADPALSAASKRPTVTDQPNSKAQLSVFKDSSDDGQRDTQKQEMGLLQFSLIGTVACMGAFLLSGGYVVFGNAFAGSGNPPTMASTTDHSAGPTTMAAIVHDGLKLWDVHFERKLSNGREYLSVEAMVRNDGVDMKSIPALRLLFGPEGAKARYRIERGENLQPGEQLVFTSRIPLRDTDPVNPVLQFIR